MDRLLRVFTKCALVGVFVALLVWVVSPCFGAYSVGVKTGDWVKYEGSASGFEPDEFLDLSQMEWMRGEVLDVSGTTVTVQMTAHYTNGSESVQKLVGDVAAASGNLTFMLMPAGLEKGDAFPIAMFDLGQVSLFINDTVSRTYLGASRSMNVLSLSVSEDFVSLEVGAYWDQATGVLMELSMQVSAMGQNMQLSIEAIETNVWSAGSFLGGDPASNLIYLVGIVATVIAVVAVAVVLFVRRPRAMPVPIPVGVPA
jgi:hypothetical protein